MSSEMRKLIEVIEEATIDSYMVRLVEATTQEEFDNILKEAELNEAPGMVQKIKNYAKMAGLTGLAIGSMMGAGDAKADTAVDMSPNTDSAYSQMDVTGPDGDDPSSASTGGLKPDMMKHYPTSKHFEVADKILKGEYQEWQAKVKEFENVRFGKSNYNRDDANTLKQEVRQAGHDYLASLRLLSNVVKLDKYKDNPDRLSRIVAPATGADAAVDNFKLYLKNVQQYEAGPSAERNLPK